MHVTSQYQLPVVILFLQEYLQGLRENFLTFKYGTFFYISYGFKKKKKLSTFLKVLNFSLWHLFIKLIDSCKRIFVKKKFFEKYINLNF